MATGMLGFVEGLEDGTGMHSFKQSLLFFLFSEQPLIGSVHIWDEQVFAVRLPQNQFTWVLIPPAKGKWIIGFVEGLGEGTGMHSLKQSLLFFLFSEQPLIGSVHVWDEQVFAVRLPQNQFTWVLIPPAKGKGITGVAVTGATAGFIGFIKGSVGLGIGWKGFEGIKGWAGFCNGFVGETNLASAGFGTGCKGWIAAVWTDLLVAGVAFGWKGFVGLFAGFTLFTESDVITDGAATGFEGFTGICAGLVTGFITGLITGAKVLFCCKRRELTLLYWSVILTSCL